MARRRRAANGGTAELPVKVTAKRVDTVRVRPVPAAWQTSGHDAPVFVDESGRRAQRVNLAGVAMVLLCACWLTTLVLGMSGFTTVPGSHLPAAARAIAAHRPILDVERTAGSREFADEYGTPQGRDTYALDREIRSVSCRSHGLLWTPAATGSRGARSASSGPGVGACGSSGSHPIR